MRTDVISINEKKGSWIREQEGGYERIWTEESKNIIIISKTVRNNFKISSLCDEIDISYKREERETTYNFSVETLGEFYMLALHFHPTYVCFVKHILQHKR